MAGLAKKRQERQIAAGVDKSEIYDPLGDRHKEWMEYVGEYAPVVEFYVRPKTGQTSGSAFANLLGAVAAGYAGTTYYGSYNYEFKADLDEFWITDTQGPVPELLRGMNIMPIQVSGANAWGSYSMEDIAQQGVFIFLPEPFIEAYTNKELAPEGKSNQGSTSPRVGTTRVRSSSYAPPSQLVMHLKDLKKPGEEIEVPIPFSALEQIYADFEGLRDMQLLRSVDRDRGLPLQLEEAGR